MSGTSAAALPGETPVPGRELRGPGKQILHWLRRAHLYLGLFLFPWAVLYGVTAFLFNHPTAFSDQPMVTFDSNTLKGTPLETPPIPAELAIQVVEALNARLKPATPYKLVAREHARFNREFAFATVQADGQQLGVLVDVAHGTGTVRATPAQQPGPAVKKAPFAVGNSGSIEKRGRRLPGAPRSGEPTPGKADAAHSLMLANPLAERIKAAVPMILERTGFPTGAVTVTSVPDVTFQIEADGKVWQASYNAQTGTVSGKAADNAAIKPELSARSFLLRLHLAHGYPSSLGARWFWALVVDVMAVMLVFWGLSGLLMWWQIRSTRRLGLTLLLLSTVTASALAYGMHVVLTQ